MRKILLIGISLVLLTTGTALAVRPQPQPEPSAAGNMELIGFTTATTAPNIGPLGMTQMCQAEYTDSRFCTSAEVLATTNVPTLPGVSAWVQPTPIYINEVNFIDVSGYTSSHSLYYRNCQGWNDSSLGSYGFTVTNKGIFSALSCTETATIACCAPAQ